MRELLNLSAEQLKRMPKETVHEGYKKILAEMLMDFYVDCTNTTAPLETLGDLNNFIDYWLSRKIKSPHPDWNPGDSGI